MATGTRIELYAGSMTETGFLETDSGRIFYVMERPHDMGDFAVLVCSPLLSEQLRNNRREVLLTRYLAARGVPTLRFHYIGAGNSDDEPGGLTVDSMIRDISAAGMFLENATNLQLTTVLGTRLGATAAAHADLKADKYALWDPVVNGTSFGREVVRARLIIQMKKTENVTASTLNEELATTGRLDAVGFLIEKTLVDSAKDFRFPTDATNVTAVQTTLFRKSGLGGAEEKALTAWAPSVGSAHEVVNSSTEESWWFHQNTNLLSPAEFEAAYEETVNSTGEWIMRVNA